MADVLILHDAFDGDLRPDEADVLDQAAAVAAALGRLGHRARCQAVGLDLAPLWATLRGPQRPDVVWNLVESAAGLGRLIVLAPALLDASGVAVAGCGADSFATTCNKPLAKRWMTLAGVATAPWWTVAALQARGDAAVGARCIVKSAWEHASLGLEDDAVFAADTPCARVAAFARAQAARFGGAFFAEAFVGGREFNIGLLDDGEGGCAVLPIAEIAFEDWAEGQPKMVGYRAKWDERSREYQRTPRRFVDEGEAELLAALADVARRCWQLFDLGGYARVDVRLGDDGAARVLEVNANPCLAADAGFVAAAARAGLGFDDVVARILAAAR